MPFKINFKVHYLILFLLYAGGLAFFYYKYVPLVTNYQLVLLPLLILSFLLAVINLEIGLFYFIFLFPLVNHLPYHFGLFQNIPQAPPSLLLFLFLLGGFLFRQAFGHQTLHFHFEPQLKNLLILFLLLISSSALVAFLRYTNFFPFLSPGLYELIVNQNKVTAGGAIMSVIFSGLNYLCGITFFFLLSFSFYKKNILKNFLRLLYVSLGIILLFSFLQKFVSPSLGNEPYWINLSRLNSTFKDPNSLSFFLSAITPFLIGIYFFIKSKIEKKLIILLIILNLVVIAFTGTRSSFLGCILGGFLVITYITISRSDPLQIRSKIVILFLILLSFLSTYFIFLNRTILVQRLQERFPYSLSRTSINQTTTRKLDLWKIAIHMGREYPLTGVGVGAYIVELPNFAYKADISLGKYTDSAENYFLQIGSELGFLGIIIIFLIFYIIASRAFFALKNKGIPREQKYLIIGLNGAFAAIFINYLFHSYIGSFEAKFIFWLLVFLLFYLQAKFKENPKRPKKRKITNLTLISTLILLFFSVNLWQSVTSLSIWNQSQKFGWAQEFGFYPLEKDSRNFTFKWAQQKAGFSLISLGDKLMIPLLATHPDIRTKNVVVKIFESDHVFRKKRLLTELNLKRKTWTTIEIPQNDSFGKWVYYLVETDRSWKPIDFNISSDSRELAVAFGEPWFKYPTKPPFPFNKIIQVETIPAQTWSPNQFLHSKGKRSLQINIKPSQNGTVYFRFTVKGTKVFDIGPYFSIYLDKKIIAKSYLQESKKWIFFFVPAHNISPGEHLLEIEFENDLWIPEKKLDRNLILGEVKIFYLKQ